MSKDPHAPPLILTEAQADDPELAEAARQLFVRVLVTEPLHPDAVVLIGQSIPAMMRATHDELDRLAGILRIKLIDPYTIDPDLFGLGLGPVERITKAEAIRRYGMSIERDGQQLDPSDFYIQPPEAEPAFRRPGNAYHGGPRWRTGLQKQTRR